MDLYKTLVVLHAITGTVALITFWIAGLSRKGGPLHKRAGKIYLIAMCGILITGFPMAVMIALRAQPVTASFLAYLLIITGTAMWNSWSAIRNKKDVRAYTGRIQRLLIALNLISGLAIAYIGLMLAKDSQLIISAFSMIGIHIAWRMWRFSRKQEHEPKWWLREHINAMLGNGVATHIAFLSIGLPKLLPMLAGPTLQNMAWLGPLVVAVLAGFYLSRKYVPKRA
jgi:hypothetical protein